MKTIFARRSLQAIENQKSAGGADDKRCCHSYPYRFSRLRCHLGGRSQPRRATRHGSSVDRRRSFREQKRYRAHGFLNLLMIKLVMWPSFQQQVKPALSNSLHKRYYEAAVTHAALG